MPSYRGLPYSTAAKLRAVTPRPVFPRTSASAGYPSFFGRLSPAEIIAQQGGAPSASQFGQRASQGTSGYQTPTTGPVMGHQQPPPFSPSRPLIEQIPSAVRGLAPAFQNFLNPVAPFIQGAFGAVGQAAQTARETDQGIFNVLFGGPQGVRQAAQSGVSSLSDYEKYDPSIRERSDQQFFQDRLGDIEGAEQQVGDSLAALDQEREQLLALARQTSELMGQEAAEPYNQRIADINEEIADLQTEHRNLGLIHEDFRNRIEGPFREAERLAAQITTDELIRIAASGQQGIEGAFTDAQGNMGALLERIGSVNPEAAKQLAGEVSLLESPIAEQFEAQMKAEQRILEAKAGLIGAESIAHLLNAQQSSRREQAIGEHDINKAIEGQQKMMEEVQRLRDKAVQDAQRQAWSQFNMPEMTPDQFASQAVEDYMSTLPKGIDRSAVQEAIGFFLNLGYTTSDDIDREDRQSLIDEFGLDTANAIVGSFARWTEAIRAYSAAPPGAEKVLQNPDLQRRAAQITQMVPWIEEQFGVISWGQWRALNQVGATGYTKSDHYWGGAIDFHGDPEAMARLAQAAGSWPGVNYVLFNEPGHYDHVHISFVPPPGVALPTYGGGSHAGHAHSPTTATPSTYSAPSAVVGAVTARAGVV